MGPKCKHTNSEDESDLFQEIRDSHRHRTKKSSGKRQKMMPCSPIRIYCRRASLAAGRAGPCFVLPDDELEAQPRDCRRKADRDISLVPAGYRKLVRPLRSIAQWWSLPCALLQGASPKRGMLTFIGPTVLAGMSSCSGSM